MKNTYSSIFILLYNKYLKTNISSRLIFHSCLCQYHKCYDQKDHSKQARMVLWAWLESKQFESFLLVLRILGCLKFLNYLYWASWYKYTFQDQNLKPKLKDLAEMTVKKVESSQDGKAKASRSKLASEPRLRDFLSLMKLRILKEKKQTCENAKMPGSEACNVISMRQLSTEIEIWK